MLNPKHRVHITQAQNTVNITQNIEGRKQNIETDTANVTQNTELFVLISVGLSGFVLVLLDFSSVTVVGATAIKNYHEQELISNIGSI